MSLNSCAWINEDKSPREYVDKRLQLIEIMNVSKAGKSA